ncbi:hypothetical protein [Bdellovibrio sp. HCB288]|uniref:hypothetical protein n=1 Tax=Bdellovibrio sp. HCB288 TaxID=3394355 RepID=UPI0039B69EF5
MGTALQKIGQYKRSNLEQEIINWIHAMRYQPRTRQNRMVIYGLVQNLRAIRQEKAAA